MRHEHTVEPGLKLTRFGGILLARDFDTGLDFADGDGGEVELIGRHTLHPVKDGRMRRGAAEFGDDVGVEKVHALVELGRGTTAELSARRCEFFGARLGGEQQFLEGGASHLLQPAPMLDGDEYGLLDAAPGDDLRPFSEAGFEQFAEAGLGFLYLPDVFHAGLRGRLEQMLI